MTWLSTRIVGIGSPHGDDQAGWLVARRLAAVLTIGNVSVEQANSAASLLGLLDGVDRLILCDACRGIGRAGQVRRWRWPSLELAEARWSGSHDLPLPAALQIAERLGRLPRYVVVWAVQGAVSAAAAPISPQVEAALPKLIQRIANEAARGAAESDLPCTNVRL